ncbi:hypothetical protein EDD85DRAFT_958003 [Armillaria nabsnona]|nr:hypothetical protein EDD85DRAFT_958003 [Armillaria nabsnona]
MSSYDARPLYLERRLGSEPSLHVAVLLSAAGVDILLVTPKDAPVSVPHYRLISEVFDTSFLGRALKTLCGCYHLVGIPVFVASEAVVDDADGDITT